MPSFNGKSVMNKLTYVVSAIALCGFISAVDASEREDFLASQVTPNSLVGTTLKCVVTPGPFVYHEDYCPVAYASNGYTVAYRVFAPAGGSYSYLWQVPNVRGQSIVSGCTSTQNLCTLSVARFPSDVDNTIGVTVTDLIYGGNISDYASYSIPATCAFAGGWTFC